MNGIGIFHIVNCAARVAAVLSEGKDDTVPFQLFPREQLAVLSAVRGGAP